jgi:hypothetical protein
MLILGLAITAEAKHDESLSSASDLTSKTTRWLGPDGSPLPFTEHEEILEFLRTADVVATKVLSSGSNRPLKVKLEKDGVTANAIFRNVHATENIIEINRKTYRDFRDSYANEGAAYELSRLLGIDNVPPCVSRTIDGKEGTLQLWVENAKSMTDRVEEGIATLANEQWTLQRQMMRVFDALIYNFDRNTGNMLIDSRGTLWFIDHTRSFLVTGRVEDIDNIFLCERTAWERLQALNDEVLDEHLHPYLDRPQIATLLDRRDKLVKHFKKLIETKGEQAVLFDASELNISE